MPPNDYSVDSRSMNKLPSLNRIHSPNTIETAENIASILNNISEMTAETQTTSVTLNGDTVQTAFIIVKISMFQRFTIRAIAEKLSPLNYELIITREFPHPADVERDTTIDWEYRNWVLTPCFYTWNEPQEDTQFSCVQAYQGEQIKKL